MPFIKKNNKKPNNKEDKKKEECSLCEISEETIKKLKDKEKHGKKE